MEIPLEAQVECKDGIYGQTEYVLINPVLDKVTHLVVKDGSPDHKEYILPVEMVTGTIADTVQLSCSKSELVMREGHLWGKKEVVIPISAIDSTLDETVYLKLDKKQIEALPTIPVHRLWT
jgi:uncharacterized protein YifN (PemK superfamily)